MSPKSRQYFLVFAAMALVLFTFCPIKSSIKGLIGLPAKTEQGLPKNSSLFFGNDAGRCISSEGTETRISQSIPVNADNLLPVVLLATAFLFSSIRSKEAPHPLYGSVRIPRALPIFLQYRKLLI